MFTRGNKYRAQKTVVDGQTFDSKAEAARYLHLRQQERNGEILRLERQVKFPCRVHGRLICTYIADFVYWMQFGFEGSDEQRIVEDVKGFKTPVYRLKKKLVEALYGCTILEVTPARPRSTRTIRPKRRGSKNVD